MLLADYVKDELLHIDWLLRHWRQWQHSSSPDLGESYRQTARNTAMHLVSLINCKDVSIPDKLDAEVRHKLSEVLEATNYS